jgi:hypothetical protein
MRPSLLGSEIDDAPTIKLESTRGAAIIVMSRMKRLPSGRT